MEDAHLLDRHWASIEEGKVDEQIPVLPKDVSIGHWVMRHALARRAKEDLLLKQDFDDAQRTGRLWEKMVRKYEGEERRQRVSTRHAVLTDRVSSVLHGLHSQGFGRPSLRGEEEAEESDESEEMEQYEDCCSQESLAAAEAMCEGSSFGREQLPDSLFWEDMDHPGVMQAMHDEAKNHPRGQRTDVYRILGADADSKNCNGLFFREGNHEGFPRYVNDFGAFLYAHIDGEDVEWRISFMKNKAEVARFSPAQTPRTNKRRAQQAALMFQHMLEEHGPDDHDYCAFSRGVPPITGWRRSDSMPCKLHLQLLLQTPESPIQTLYLQKKSPNGRILTQLGNRLWKITPESGYARIALRSQKDWAAPSKRFVAPGTVLEGWEEGVEGWVRFELTSSGASDFLADNRSYYRSTWMPLLYDNSTPPEHHTTIGSENRRFHHSLTAAKRQAAASDVERGVAHWMARPGTLGKQSQEALRALSPRMRLGCFAFLRRHYTEWCCRHSDWAYAVAYKRENEKLNQQKRLWGFGIGDGWRFDNGEFDTPDFTMGKVNPYWLQLEDWRVCNYQIFHTLDEFRCSDMMSTRSELQVALIWQSLVPYRNPMEPPVSNLRTLSPRMVRILQLLEVRRSVIRGLRKGEQLDEFKVLSLDHLRHLATLVDSMHKELVDKTARVALLTIPPIEALELLLRLERKPSWECWKVLPGAYCTDSYKKGDRIFYELEQNPLEGGRTGTLVEPVPKGQRRTVLVKWESRNRDLHDQDHVSLSSVIKSDLVRAKNLSTTIIDWAVQLGYDSINQQYSMTHKDSDRKLHKSKRSPLGVAYDPYRRNKNDHGDSQDSQFDTPRVLLSRSLTQLCDTGMQTKEFVACREKKCEVLLQSDNNQKMKIMNFARQKRQEEVTKVKQRMLEQAEETLDAEDQVKRFVNLAEMLTRTQDLPSGPEGQLWNEWAASIVVEALEELPDPDRHVLESAVERPSLWRQSQASNLIGHQLGKQLLFEDEPPDDAVRIMPPMRPDAGVLKVTVGM